MPALEDSQRNPEQLVEVVRANPREATDAVRQLKERGKAALYAIGHLLDDTNPDVRMAGLKAVEWASYDPILDLLLIRCAHDPVLKVRQELADYLVEHVCNIRTLHIILELLANSIEFEWVHDNENLDVELHLDQALQVFGSKAIPALLQACGSNRSEIRYAALIALGSVFKHFNSIAPVEILALLEDDDPRVRSRTLHILWIIRDILTVPRIRQRLDDPEPFVALSACDTLGFLGYEEEARLYIRQYLGGQPPPIRARAFSCLIHVKPEAQDLPEIFRGMDDGSSQVVEVACVALNVVSRNTLEPDMIRRIIGYLDDERDTVRKSIIGTLKDIGGDPVLDALIARLDKETGPLKKKIVAALRDSNDPRVLPVLIGLLNDPDPKIRTCAVQGIGNMDLGGNLPILHQVLLTDNDFSVQQSIIRRIMNHGITEFCPTLRKMLGDSFPYLRYECAIAAGKLRDTEATSNLILLLNDAATPVILDERGVVSQSAGYRVCDVAAWALTQIGTQDASAAVAASGATVGGFKNITHTL